MLMFKESQGTKNDDAFVHIVSCTPEPMAVLASIWTLNDLDRFCTSPHCTILCIDLTFQSWRLQRNCGHLPPSDATQLKWKTSSNEWAFGDP